MNVTKQWLTCASHIVGPEKRAFREFTTHTCPPADSALLILKTAVLRTDSYRFSTVLPRGIWR